MEGNLIHPVLNDSLYVAQGIDYLPCITSFRIFRPGRQIAYVPFCDDFGPMSMSSVVKFIVQLDKELADHPHCRLFIWLNMAFEALQMQYFFSGHT